MTRTEDPQTPADRSNARRRRLDGVLALLALAGIGALLLAAPHGLLDKADHAAFAVCHRIPERSFIFAGRPLPLCARCSGTYLGALAGLVVLMARGRGRAGELPAIRHLAVLGTFMMAWAFDGLNSYLTFFPTLPHLYEPNNLLRLITGTLEGITIAAVLLPILNISLTANPRPLPSVGGWTDLAWMVVGGAAVFGMVSSEWAALLYPLALVSGVAIVLLLGSVNAMIAAIALRREGRARSWRALAPLLLIGVFLALGEIALIAAGRTALTARFGLPF